MTREEAINILIREKDEDPFVRTEYRNKIHEALNMAIKVLEQGPCEDCVSRTPVKKAIDEMLEWIESDNRHNCDYFIVDKIEEIIKELSIDTLPSVQPKAEQEPKIYDPDKMTTQQVIDQLNNIIDTAQDRECGDVEIDAFMEEAIERAIKVLEERESILDKIREEILGLDDAADYDYEGYYKAVTDAVKIIDKYRAESER